MIFGLSFLLLGLIGLVIKSGLTKERENSVTGGKIVYGTYSLLISGLVLVILSLLSM